MEGSTKLQCPGCGVVHPRGTFQAKCCNPKCQGQWGTGCYHCRHPDYWTEPPKDEATEATSFDRTPEERAQLFFESVDFTPTDTEVERLAAEFNGMLDGLRHWREWAAMFDPYPDETPDNDNQRRARVNWWIEMLEGNREPTEAFLEKHPERHPAGSCEACGEAATVIVEDEQAGTIRYCDDHNPNLTDLSPEFCAWWHAQTGQVYGGGPTPKVPQVMREAAEAFEAGRATAASQPNPVGLPEGAWLMTMGGCQRVEWEDNRNAPAVTKVRARLHAGSIDCIANNGDGTGSHPWPCREDVARYLLLTQGSTTDEDGERWRRLCALMSQAGPAPKEPEEVWRSLVQLTQLVAAWAPKEGSTPQGDTLEGVSDDDLWGAMSCQGRSDTLEQAYDRAWGVALSRLEAAGSWLGLEPEAQRLKSHIEDGRRHAKEARTGRATDSASEPSPATPESGEDDSSGSGPDSIPPQPSESEGEGEEPRPGDIVSWDEDDGEYSVIRVSDHDRWGRVVWAFWDDSGKEGFVPVRSVTIVRRDDRPPHPPWGAPEDEEHWRAHCKAVDSMMDDRGLPTQRADGTRILTEERVAMALMSAPTWTESDIEVIRRSAVAIGSSRPDLAAALRSIADSMETWLGHALAIASAIPTGHPRA